MNPANLAVERFEARFDLLLPIYQPVQQGRQPALLAPGWHQPLAKNLTVAA
jgi:hypothetical protein